MADWASTHRLWEKWASNNIGSSGEPLKAALLLHYDPSAPSRLLSLIAEQEGTNLKAVDLNPFLDFVKRNNLQKEFFFIGPNEYLVTSIYEHWFCARCVNTLKPGGEGMKVLSGLHLVQWWLLISLHGNWVEAATKFKQDARFGLTTTSNSPLHFPNFLDSAKIFQSAGSLILLFSRKGSADLIEHLH